MKTTCMCSCKTRLFQKWCFSHSVENRSQNVPNQNDFHFFLSGWVLFSKCIMNLQDQYLFYYPWSVFTEGLIANHFKMLDHTRTRYSYQNDRNPHRFQVSPCSLSPGSLSPGSGHITKIPQTFIRMWHPAVGESWELSSFVRGLTGGYCKSVFGDILRFTFISPQVLIRQVVLNTVGRRHTLLIWQSDSFTWSLSLCIQ